MLELDYDRVQGSQNCTIMVNREVRVNAVDESHAKQDVNILLKQLK